MGEPRLRIDDDAHMAYVTIGDGNVDRTVSLSDLIMVDLDASGSVVGVEFPYAVPSAPRNEQGSFVCGQPVLYDPDFSCRKLVGVAWGKCHYHRETAS